MKKPLPQAASPTRTVQLKNSQFNKRLNDKEFEGTSVFSITTDDIELLVQLEDEETWKQTTEAVDENLKKAARPPLNKDKKMGRLAALRDKTKKNVIDKAATSSMGKKAIRAKAPKEITNLIDAIKQIAKRESNSQKKADEVEQNLFKIGVKAYILVSQKKISLADLLVADKPIREALEVFSKCYHHVVDYQTTPEKIQIEQLKLRLKQVETLVKQAGEALANTLKGQLSANSITRLNDTIKYLANPEALLIVLKDPTMYDDLNELVTAGEHYSQFYYYADD